MATFELIYFLWLQMILGLCSEGKHCLSNCTAMLKKNRRKWDKRARNFLKVDVTGQIKF